LTTVDTKLEQQNILSVELLLDIMAGKGKERNLKVVPTLVARGSTGCPNI